MTQPTPKPTKTAASKAKSQREQERLAKALKANLARRKAVKKS